MFQVLEEMDVDKDEEAEAPTESCKEAKAAKKAKKAKARTARKEQSRDGTGEVLAKNWGLVRGRVGGEGGDRGPSWPRAMGLEPWAMNH